MLWMVLGIIDHQLLIDLKNVFKAYGSASMVTKRSRESAAMPDSDAHV